MSVRTTADEQLDHARDGLDSAIVALANIVVGECWGHEDYHSEFREKLDKAFYLLREAKKLIAPGR